MPEYKGGEIYGETADIRLLDFIRDEKKFNGIDELKNAIFDNAKTAKVIFNQMYKNQSMTWFKKQCDYVQNSVRSLDINHSQHDVF